MSESRITEEDNGTHQLKDLLEEYQQFQQPNFKGAVTDMRYFARSKFSRSLVHKKNFNLISK